MCGFVVLRREEAMEAPKLTLVFYEFDDVVLAVVSVVGRLSDTVLDTIRKKVGQADRATFGEVVMHELDLGGQNDQMFAILPRAQRLKREAMERLMRELLPVDDIAKPIWRNDPDSRSVWLAQVLRRNVLG